MTPKIVFMGTPEIAVPTLKAINEQYGVSLVVTTPDRPKGRGLKLEFSEVKKAALELNLPLSQPESLKSEDFANQIKEIDPDIIVVIAFRILPKAVYSTAKIATFNIHASLLPKYRGAAPINWAIINGDKTTGLTSFVLQDKVDTGNIVLQKEIPIGEETTAGELYNELMNAAPEFAINTIESLIEKKNELIVQDETKACGAPKIFRDDCKIDWSKSAVELHNFIRGVSPNPCAWSIFDGKRIKIIKSLVSEKHGEQGAYEIAQNKFFAFCSDKSIEIVELQLEGKAAIKAIDFIRGYRGALGGKFGE